MAQGALLRFLDLLRQELAADDTRAELGGRDPVDRERTLFVHVPGGWRLVVVYDDPIGQREEKQRHFERLVDGFSQTLEHGRLPTPPSPAVDSAFRRLDAALEALRTRTGAAGAVIVDVQSPVLWGSAEPHHHPEDVESLIEVGSALERARGAGLDLDTLLALEENDLGPRLREAGLDSDTAARLVRAVAEADEGLRRHHLLTCVAIARARSEAGRDPETRWSHHEPQFGYLVRSFANIYLLVLVFAGPFSELHVESTMLHALPGIEQLLLALPPLDPTPKGARVIKLRR